MLWSPLTLALACAVVLGPTVVFAGLYRVLTDSRRRSMRQIRQGAAARGWRFRVRRWMGDPTAFRIESDRGWTLTSGGTSGYDDGWTVRMTLVFAALRGAPDVAIEPRASAGGAQDALRRRSARHEGEERDRLAHVLGIADEASERLTGSSAFDERYRVAGPLTLSPSLATRFAGWPADTVAPHSMLSWRDGNGFHLQARLPSPPNWASVTYVVDLGEALCRALPPPLPARQSNGPMGRLVAKLTGL